MVRDISWKTDAWLESVVKSPSREQFARITAISSAVEPSITEKIDEVSTK